MDELNCFGVNLKKLREQRGVTQKELAEKIEITAASISAYEKQIKTPSIDVVIKIAAFFNMSLDEICGIRPNKIETFGQFIRYFALLCKTKALYPIGGFYGTEFTLHFTLHSTFDNFKSGFIEIMNLYQHGTISESLFDLWVNDEVKKWAATNIAEATTPSPKEKTENDDADGLPF